MKNVAIITARGGSKRIPKKNIKKFMDKPMIAYAIEAALNSGIFDEVMVSTDCTEIAKIAKKFGAKVPFIRSEKNSNDFATTYDVLAEVISKYKRLGIEFDNICCIYPCVPFLNKKSLTEAYSKFEGNDALIPVCKYPVPIEWAMKIENDCLIPNDKEAQNIRSQDIEPKYYDVGMFYFIKTQILINEKILMPENTFSYIIDESECQDIDTQEDWQKAEVKYKISKGIIK